MNVKVGSYTGTGSSNPIAGLGFQPGAVIIQGGTQPWQLSTSTMGTDVTKPMVGANVTYSGGVASLDAGGFTLGTSSAVNALGVVYHYIALRDNGAGDLKITSYAGNGINPHVITGIGFASDLILFAPGSGDTPGFRTSDMPTDSYYRPEDFGNLTNRVSSIDSDGFTLNLTNEVNKAATTYHVVCIKNTSSTFKALTYTGNGVDDRTITGVGFQPDATFVRDSNTAITAARYRDEVGDNSFLVDGTAEAANRIQALTSDGFQVGTATQVNTNTDTYYTFSFRSPPGSSRYIPTRIANRKVGPMALRRQWRQPSFQSYDAGTASVTASIAQVAATVTAAGGTQASSTVNNVAIAQSAATVTAAGGTQTLVSKINASITQVAATVTATGGTQTISSVQSIAVIQVAGSVTATGGTQAPTTINNVSITQTAGTVTATGGTQTNTAVQSTSITQLAGSVTATGGTEVISSVQSRAITQVAAIVTASGGTEVITTVNNVTISQSAATVTASGGTDSVSAAISTSVTQVAGSVTATGGTEVVSTVRIVAISQVAATVTATGGTQSTGATGTVSISQVAGTVTATGGTQTNNAVRTITITQSAGVVTASGGTQNTAAVINGSIVQSAGSVTASGGTQSLVSSFSAAIAQVGATVTASGGLQVIETINYAVIERSSSLTLVVPEPISLTLQQQVSSITGKQPTVTSLVYIQPTAIELTLAQRATSLTLTQNRTDLTASLQYSNALVASL